MQILAKSENLKPNWRDLIKDFFLTSSHNNGAGDEEKLYKKIVSIDDADKKIKKNELLAFLINLYGEFNKLGIKDKEIHFNQYFDEQIARGTIPKWFEITVYSKHDLYELLKSYYISVQQLYNHLQIIKNAQKNSEKLESSSTETNPSPLEINQEKIEVEIKKYKDILEQLYLVENNKIISFDYREAENFIECVSKTQTSFKTSAVHFDEYCNEHTPIWLKTSQPFDNINKTHQKSSGKILFHCALFLAGVVITALGIALAALAFLGLVSIGPLSGLLIPFLSAAMAHHVLVFIAIISSRIITLGLLVTIIEVKEATLGCFFSKRNNQSTVDISAEDSFLNRQGQDSISF